MRLAETLLLRLSRSPDVADYPSVGTAKSLDGALDQLTDPFPDLLEMIAGRDVLDFGCGLGYQTVAMALEGANRTVGVDISETGLEHGRRLATEAGVSDRVSFTNQLNDDHKGAFDVVISLNSMEHFSDPKAIVTLMATMLRPQGKLVVTFAPPWYAPYGAHMYFFTRVPWVQLLFSERTVLAVRSRFRSDGATRYEEIEGGLNRMSCRRFNRLIAESGLKAQQIQYDPVKGLKFLIKVPILRELFINRISCVLEKSAEPAAVPELAHVGSS